MEINVTLDDATLCDGCPMENGQQCCAAGFRRETARVVPMQQREAYSIFGHYEARASIGFKLMRPQVCVLATERALHAVGKLPGQFDAGAASPRTKRVFVCTKCGNQHKNYEPCRHGGR